MPVDDDDLFDGDFEFVDDDDEYEDSDEFDSELEEEDEEIVEEKPKKKPKKKAAKAPAKKKKAAPKRKRKPAAKEQSVDDASPPEGEEPSTGEAEGADADTEKTDEWGRTEPVANYVVHVYELKEFKRTVDRKFTPEDAEAFVTEYNRTSKAYNRWAVPGKEDVKPGKVLAQ